MISADLLDLIDSVVPVREHGVVGLPLGPYAAAWASSTPTIVTAMVAMETRADLRTREDPPATPRHYRRRRRRDEVLSPTALALLSIVSEMPGCTTYDLTIALRRQRRHAASFAVPAGHVARILCSLEQRGRVRRVELSRRQARAAGGSVLWEAA